MVHIFKRRKLFDEDADWVPQKGRAFNMKTKMQKEEAPREEQPKKDPFRMTAEPPDIKYDFPQKEPREKQQVLTQGVADQRDKIKTDAEGMDRAYAQGDVYGEEKQGVSCGEPHPQRLVR